MPDSFADCANDFQVDLAAKGFSSCRYDSSARRSAVHVPKVMANASKNARQIVEEWDSFTNEC